MKILLADDEMDIQMLVEMTLMEEGHEVTTVDNGQEAVDKAKEETFDVILLDNNMPVMGGLEAFETLHGDPQTSSIPVIFMTAQPSDAKIQAAIEKGATGYLQKPFNVDTLSSDLEKLLHPA